MEQRKFYEMTDKKSDNNRKNVNYDSIAAISFSLTNFKWLK